MSANEYKWAQSSNNTTLIAKDVNSASFDITQWSEYFYSMHFIMCI